MQTRKNRMLAVVTFGILLNFVAFSESLTLGNLISGMLQVVPDSTTNSNTSTSNSLAPFFTKLKDVTELTTDITQGDYVSALIDGIDFLETFSALPEPVKLILKIYEMNDCSLVRCLSKQSSPQVKTDFTNGIKEIVMCSAKTRNALSIAMMETLSDHILCDQQNNDLRAIVISAEGSVFSSGHNLKELMKRSDKGIDSPVPVIAKVDGVAAAAGCQLVAQCDIAICSEKSQFSTPGANFGIFCSTPGVALSRCVNKMPALYMLLTGLPVSAQEAFQIGLITKVRSSDQLNEEIENICRAIKTKSRDVIELGKRFYYKQIQYDVKKAYELGGDKMVENLQLPDCKEGIQSFIEKRKPQWGTGKD
ncbi:hypothetical protein HUJ04_007518 [Dendroctonus ponderosae]|nr:hypothetical protein HUJ04_007518 [Dendroctonus ponderosae]